MRVLVLRLVVAVVLAAVPHTALAQESGLIRFEARSGAEVQAEELGEILASSTEVSYPGWVLRMPIRVELISREEGVVGRYESDAIEDPESDRWITINRWVPIPPLTDALAPGFGDRRKITLGRTVPRPTVRRVPRECEDATHAVVVTVEAAGDGREVADSLAICLVAEG